MRATLMAAVLASGLAVQAGTARAVVLLDTGLNASAVALSATADDYLIPGPPVNYYTLMYQTASRISLAQGGIADAFTFVGADQSWGGQITLYRATNTGRLVSSPAQRVWSGDMNSASSTVQIGHVPNNQYQPMYQYTFGGLAITLDPGDYWVALSTQFATFGQPTILAAGAGSSPFADRSFVDYPSSPFWREYGDTNQQPQVSIRIDASQVFPPPTNVPEPAVWGLMILGFGLVGASLRRDQTHRGVLEA